VIYAVIDLDTSPSIKTAMRKYKRILLALDRKQRQHKLHSLTPEEARIYSMFEQISERNKFKKAATQRMRAQCGQHDRFLQAIQVSGLYQQKFEQIFQQYGLPIELTRIPFVESYFKHNAYSYAGAAGIWQFMPATARMYGLRINSKIDERYDPFKSAESAARLLKANYEIFHSWPLAITAYNHGPGGLLKAVKTLGTKDLGKIVRKYRGARFGFYSRNYYAQFLAAAQVMHDPKQYFTAISPLPPLRYDQVVIKKPIFLNEIITTLAVPKKTLLALNRDLKRAVTQSKAPLPSNFILKLPPGKREEFLTQYASQTEHRT
jgi:membrane-bound lytic murein transglycosylase D